MQQLEPIHEKAIDLLVSGKRQHEVAAELQISTRTLRRWGDNPDFVTELNQQHALARKLDQDEATQLRREHRELQRLALQQIKANLTDPQAPIELKKHCLRLSLMAMHFDIAQEWREFVYFDRKKEHAETRSAPDKSGHLPVPPASTPQASVKNEPKADKSGQPGQKNALIDAVCADVVRESNAKR